MLRRQSSLGVQNASFIKFARNPSIYLLYSSYPRRRHYCHVCFPIIWMYELNSHCECTVESPLSNSPNRRTRSLQHKQRSGLVRGTPLNHPDPVGSPTGYLTICAIGRTSSSRNEDVLSGSRLHVYCLSTSGVLKRVCQGWKFIL